MATIITIIFLLSALYTILLCITHPNYIKSLNRIHAEKSKLFLKKKRRLKKGKHSTSLNHASSKKNKTDIFIIINSRSPSYVPAYLEDCVPPLCAYQVFVDDSENFTSINNTVAVAEYPKHMLTAHAYSSFGHRARYQMRWAIKNADFDWLIKVDDDGYLCIDSLIHTLRHNNAPKEKFIFGRFWCKPDSYKPDENFLAMSRDAVQYFLVGWKKKWLQFHGKITLGLNIGVQLSYLHHTCGWTFWSDQYRFRWYEELKPTDGCNSHVWIHHVQPNKIDELHEKHKKEPFDQTIKRNNTLSKNHTGCSASKSGTKTADSNDIIIGLPHFHYNKLEKLIAIQGSSKGNRVTGSINFTKYRTNDDYC